MAILGLRLQGLQARRRLPRLLCTSGQSDYGAACSSAEYGAAFYDQHMAPSASQSQPEASAMTFLCCPILPTAAQRCMPTRDTQRLDTHSQEDNCHCQFCHLRPHLRERSETTCGGNSASLQLPSPRTVSLPTLAPKSAWPVRQGLW